MLSQKVDVNMCDQYNQTPLQIAIAVNHCEIVEIILNNKDIKYANDYENNNELHVWVDKACEICLNKLIKVIKNETIYEKNVKGNNAIHQSIIVNNILAFKLLIEKFKYKDFNLQGESNYNLLQLCCVYGDIVN